MDPFAPIDGPGTALDGSPPLAVAPDDDVWATVAVDDPAAVWELLRQRAGEGDAEVFAEAAKRGPGAVMAAVLAHADDPDPAARALAVRAGGSAGEDGIVLAVLALSDPDPQVRRAAVEVCRQDTTADCAIALRRLVTDPDRDVRAAVVELLAASDDEDAVASLVPVLADPDGHIRAMAREALRERTSPEVARLLVDALGTEGGREATAALLLDMGDVGRRAVDEAWASLSREALVAVGPILGGAGGADDRYAADLASLDPHARLRAVRRFGAIGGPAATSALLGRLHDPVDDIRIEALEHIGRTGGADAIPLLREVSASDPVPAVVAAAVRALDRVMARVGSE